MEPGRLNVMRVAYTHHPALPSQSAQTELTQSDQEPELLRSSEPDALPDTEQFIRRVFDTNPQKGCELLFRLYYKPMCTHAVRFVYAKDVAEDLVSDVFYTFWNTRAYENVQQSFRAFLFRSVRNRAYNYLANEFHKADPLDLVEQQATLPADGPELMMRYNELFHKVDELVESLPPQCRSVFILNRFEGKKAKDIADQMQLSVRTIEVHIAKALTTLREGLRNQWLSVALIVFFSHLSL